MDNIIICDLDGTVSQIGDRLAFIQAEKKDWDAFYDAVGTDTPIEPVCRLVRKLMVDGYPVIYLTGRSDRVYDKTKKWLEDNFLWNQDPDKCLLLMRKEGDHRHDMPVKLELLEKYLHDSDKTPEDVWFILEDRNAVVSMWRTMGYTVLQPQDGNF